MKNLLKIVLASARFIVVMGIFSAFSLPGFGKSKAKETAEPPKWQMIEDNGKYDLVMRAKPVKSTQISKGGISDAVENIPNLKELTVNVYFRIEKMEKGRLPKVISEPVSKSKQFSDAVDRKDFKAVLLSDYDMHAKEYSRQRFRVAVADPVKIFGFTFWDQFDEEKVYRLYFKKYHTQDTYVMMKSEVVPSA